MNVSPEAETGRTMADSVNCLGAGNLPDQHSLVDLGTAAMSMSAGWLDWMTHSGALPKIHIYLLLG